MFQIKMGEAILYESAEFLGSDELLRIENILIAMTDALKAPRPSLTISMHGVERSYFRFTNQVMRQEEADEETKDL